LTWLNYLDDQSISKDERLRHFNMKSYADAIKNESDVTITVLNLKNVYMPFELKVILKNVEILFDYYIAFILVSRYSTRVPAFNI
jgi:hypothetical protein